MEHNRVEGEKKIIIKKCTTNDVNDIYNIQKIVIDNFKENEEILRRWYLYCPHCKNRIYLDRFVFYNCHKENGEYVKGRYNNKKK